MKRIILLMVFLPSLVSAQMPPCFNAKNMGKMEAQMQSMMSNMANMQKCMSKVDQSKIDSLGQKAEKLEQEVSDLCAKGQKTAAKNKIIKFSKQMRHNTELNKMKKCMAPMGAMMEAMPFENKYEDIESGKQNVCGE